MYVPVPIGSECIFSFLLLLFHPLNLDLALIAGPYLYNTNGIAVNNNVKNPNILEPHPTG